MQPRHVFVARLISHMIFFAVGVLNCSPIATAQNRVISAYEQPMYLKLTRTPLRGHPSLPSLPSPALPRSYYRADPRAVERPDRHQARAGHWRAFAAGAVCAERGGGASGGRGSAVSAARYMRPMITFQKENHSWVV